MPADKGKATVILDKAEYEDKVTTMLSDARTYRPLNKDPTPRFKSKLIAILTRLKDEKKITPAQYHHLYPTSDVAPRLYCTPKVHKAGTPLRPIVDYTGSMAYAVSKDLSDLLFPLAGKTEHHVLNSKEFVQEVKQLVLAEDEALLSHDVVSLFTNVPIPEALAVIRARLEHDTSLNERTNLTVDDIMTLLEFVMSTTYFLFRGKFFEQVFGTAMGSPVSVVVSNLYMEDLEQRALTTAPPEIKPRFWKRFVDDVFEVVKRGVEEALTEHLNSIDATGSIKFTYEGESDGKLPFLDTLVARQPDGTLKTTVYRKKTHTDQYLAFDSNHPLNHKLGVVRTLLDRCSNVVSEEEDRKQEEEHVEQALRTCGYPKWAITRTKKSIAEQATRESKKKPPTLEDRLRSRGQVSVPYVAGISEGLARVFKRHKVQTTMKPCQSLRQALVHPKDKRPLEDTTDAVYRIPCKQCPKAYVGESGRRLGTRLKEHQRDVRKVDDAAFTRSQRQAAADVRNQSAIADHASQCNHVIDWDETSVLSREADRPTRWVREAIHIRREGDNALNRDEGQHELPTLFNPLIAKLQVSTKL